MAIHWDIIREEHNMMRHPELEEALQSLPSVARQELLDFLEYLQYKYRLDESSPAVKLGGMWAGIDFDVGDEDIRDLRHQVTTSY